MATRKSTLLIEDIFDPKKGWAFPEHEVSVEKSRATDGSPMFVVDVDGIDIIASQVTAWKRGVKSAVAPGRLVASTWFENVTITDAQSMLRASHNSRALPAFVIADDGDLGFETAFPVADGFPLDVARKQLLFCMALLAEEAREFIDSLNAKPTQTPQAPSASGTPRSDAAQVDWDTVGKVATVGGKLLHSFVFG